MEEEKLKEGTAKELITRGLKEEQKDRLFIKHATQVIQLRVFFEDALLRSLLSIHLEFKKGKRESVDTKELVELTAEKLAEYASKIKEPEEKINEAR